MDRIAPKPRMAFKNTRIGHFFPTELTERLTPAGTVFETTSMGVPGDETLYRPGPRRRPLGQGDEASVGGRAGERPGLSGAQERGAVTVTVED